MQAANEVSLRRPAGTRTVVPAPREEGSVKQLLFVLVSLAFARPGAADPIFKQGAFPEVDAAIARHERQFFHLNAAPFGLSLDATPKDADAVAAIQQFCAQDASDDVKAVTGKHPFELMSEFGEHGDLGMFGGVPAAGTAYRYLALKREGADAKTLADARTHLVRAIESWHVFYVVTGGNGVIARGIYRLKPENADDPPIPGTPPTPVPFHDGDGKPLPFPKDNGTWRADNSGGVLPAGTWMWVDSASTDQMNGQMFGMAALYDAAVDDPDIDPSLVARMRDDARGVAKMLMTKREVSGFEKTVGSGEYDLIIMDADGRPTLYHDLNPLGIQNMYATPDMNTWDTFNLVNALGVVKALHHVTGDKDLEDYLYVELLKNRGYLGMLNKTTTDGALDYIYMGISTNYSNVNMVATSLWNMIYLENDPVVLAEYRTFLEGRWWDKPGVLQTAKNQKQAFFNAIYLGLTDKGTDAARVQQTAALIAARGLGPYFSPARLNCDAAELAAGSCVAVDGKTVLKIQDGKDMDGNRKADEALDTSIRPTSNFDSRSDPFDLNGGEGANLNPGGDYLATYWMLRWLEAKPAGQAHVSPHARAHEPVGGTVVAEPAPEDGADEGGVEPAPEVVEADVVEGPSVDGAAGDTATDGTVSPDVPAEGSGGGCASGQPGGGPASSAGLLPLLLAAIFLRRARPS